MKVLLALTLAVVVRCHAPGTQSCLYTGCKGNGICVDLGNNHYTCDNAAAGTFSTSCHVDPCVDGSCVDQPDGSSKCVCGPGKALDQDKHTCIPVAENCPNKPCKDGACQTAPDMSKRCVCNQGYRNSAADPTVCEPATGGSTTEDCRVRPCKYGVCFNKAGKYECQCIQGYRLSARDKSLCEPFTPVQTSYNPCANVYCTNGYCRPDMYGYGRCMCYQGYRPTNYPGYCARIYTPPPRPTCATFPCENGYCVQSYTGHRSCQCHQGFQPDQSNPQRCQQIQSQPASTNTWNANDLSSLWNLQYLLEEL